MPFSMLQRLLRLDPLSEDLYRRLMRLFGATTIVPARCMCTTPVSPPYNGRWVSTPSQQHAQSMSDLCEQVEPANTRPSFTNRCLRLLQALIGREREWRTSLRCLAARL